MITLKQFQQSPNGSKLFVASVSNESAALTIQFSDVDPDSTGNKRDLQGSADELLPEARRVLNKLIEEND